MNGSPVSTLKNSAPVLVCRMAILCAGGMYGVGVTVGVAVGSGVRVGVVVGVAVDVGAGVSVEGTWAIGLFSVAGTKDGVAIDVSVGGTGGDVLHAAPIPIKRHTITKTIRRFTVVFSKIILSFLMCNFVTG